jgi:hypothetical protein
LSTSPHYYWTTIFALAAVARLHTIALVNNPKEADPALAPQRQTQAFLSFI